MKRATLAEENDAVRFKFASKDSNSSALAKVLLRLLEDAKTLDSEKIAQELDRFELDARRALQSAQMNVNERKALEQRLEEESEFVALFRVENFVVEQRELAINQETLILGKKLEEAMDRKKHLQEYDVLASLIQKYPAPQETQA
jgi:hypothetical protein